MKSRCGFTFIELLMTMTVVGILSAIAVPKYIDLKRRANSTKVIGDFQAVRVAVMSFYADSSYFPAETGPGTTPPGLQRYLPVGFTFNRPEWTLDFENWNLSGPAAFTDSPSLIAVSVTTQDAQLALVTARAMGNVAQFGDGNRYTFMISGM